MTSVFTQWTEMLRDWNQVSWLSTYFLFHHAVPWMSFSLTICWLCRGCEKKVACCVSKQEMLQPSTNRIAAALTVSPEGTQDGNRMPAEAAMGHRPLQPPCQWALRTPRMGKHRMLAPDRCTEVSEPRLLHLPKHREARNSSTWDIWLSLINSNLLNSD